MVNALVKNKTVLQMDSSDNEIGDGGAKAMVNALEKTKTLL